MRTAHSRPARNVIAVLAIAATGALALTSCAGGGSPSVSKLEDVKTATIQIQADGTFIQPGTLDPVEEGSRGSGFFIGSDGLALTNNHVVTGAGTLTVWVGGDQGKSYDATVLGASECLDIAVIQVNGLGAKFPTLSFVKGDIKQATEVYSAGFPLGDPTYTLTKGIVSKEDITQEDQWASLDHVIEHDARIRGGNSGGPLVDDNGHVLGMNYAGNDDLDYNFAIHRDQIVPVIEDLKAGKVVQSLGINAQALAPDDSGNPLGVWVESVKAGGAADKAGIKPGDVITDMGGVTLARQGTLEEYCQVIRTQGDTAPIDVTVYRPSEDSVYDGQVNGKELSLTSSGSGTANGNQGTDDGFTGFTTVSDDTNTISVDVPNTWTDVDGAGFTNNNGVKFEALSASTDLASYNAGWSTAGVTLTSSSDPASIAVDPATELQTYIDQIGSQCTLDNQDDYNDGFYVGKYAYLTSCGGLDTDFAIVVAHDMNSTHLMVLSLVMVTSADKADVLNQVTSTFQAVY